MASRQVFHDSIVPISHEGTDPALGLVVNATVPAHEEERLTVHFALGMSEKGRAALEKLVTKGKVLSPAEQRKYLPSDTSIRKLTSWLEGQGYQVNQVEPDGVYATATTSNIAKSLQVEMVRVTRDGFTQNAARTAPSLPTEVSKGVTAIGGLQPFLRAQRHSRWRTPKVSRSLTANRAAAPQVQPAPPANDFEPPYLVSEILKAYNAEGLGLTGRGQAIAILIDTFAAESDLTAFWGRDGINPDLTRVENINVRKGPLSPPQGEETLDISWASGIAPEAQIRVYASGSLAFVDLDRALDKILADVAEHPEIRQLSISLGLGETYLGAPNGEVRTQHDKYLRLAAAGVNVFVSSGDAGSNPDQTGHSSGGPAQAEYPSSDSFVVGVGGTSLTMRSPAGTVSDETGWANSGGGKSKFFDRPAWQQADGVTSGTKRLVPDVGLAADPNTGAFLILNGAEVQIGGTSWSAPVWAGFCALINEARANAGKPGLPFLNTVLYPLAGTNAFRDIDEGSNGLYTAAAGYDLVTGLGVPNVERLVAALT